LPLAMISCDNRADSMAASLSLSQLHGSTPGEEDLGDECGECQRTGHAAGHLRAQAAGPSTALVSPWPWPWREEEDQDRRKSHGQKGHFTVLLSPRKLEMNILLDGVSINKFVKNQSVL
jgi:hypothetical protein